MCNRGPKAKMLGLDYMNTEGLLYWQLHEQNVFSPGEYGCTFSHLRAIHQAFIDGEQTALIVEDDIRFEDMPLWPETLQDVVAAAPPDGEGGRRHDGPGLPGGGRPGRQRHPL